MTGTASRTDIEALAAEFALGLLSADEADAVEARLGRDPALAAALRGLEGRLAELDLTVAPVPATAALWQRIEGALGAAAPAERPALRPAARPGLWQRIGFWRPLGLATAAASLCLVAVAGILASRPLPDPIVVAVLVNDDATAGAIVEAFGDGRVAIIPLTDIEVPEGRILQVWTLIDPAEGPISLGLMPAAERAVFRVPGLPAAQSNQLYEITLEPRSGSPTGRPTGPILFQGRAVMPPT